MVVKYIKTSILFLLTSVLVLAQEQPVDTGENLNWISSISYDLSGQTKSKMINYYNTLGNSTQSHTWDIMTDTIWVSEVKYDYQGRAAFQTLSAPKGTNFGYVSGFVRNSLNGTYTTGHFDVNPDAPSYVSSTTPNTLGYYYSSNNTTEPYQDVTQYPFSRTVFSELNPGAVKKSSGRQPGKWSMATDV